MRALADASKGQGIRLLFLSNSKRSDDIGQRHLLFPFGNLGRTKESKPVWIRDLGLSLSMYDKRQMKQESSVN